MKSYVCKSCGNVYFAGRKKKHCDACKITNRSQLHAHLRRKLKYG